MPTLQSHLCSWTCRQDNSHPERLFYRSSSSQRTLVKAEGQKDGAQVAASTASGRVKKGDTGTGEQVIPTTVLYGIILSVLCRIGCHGTHVGY